MDIEHSQPLNDSFSRLTSRSLEACVCLFLLRVVRCLPSTPGLSVLDKTQRAGVGQAVVV